MNTTTMRESNRRASPQPDYSYEAVGRRGLGPREQGEQCTQHVFRGYVSCESTHRAAALLVLGSDALSREAPRRVSSRPD